MPTPVLDGVMYRVSVVDKEYGGVEDCFMGSLRDVHADIIRSAEYYGVDTGCFVEVSRPNIRKMVSKIYGSGFTVKYSVMK